MTELEMARQTIDRVDKEMARLFEERMEAVKMVAKYKSEHGLPVFDKSREDKVIEKNSSNVESDEIRPYYINYLQANMDISKKYQEALISGMKVAFSGIEGAFANIAAKRIFPGSRITSFVDFQNAYNSVVNGESDCCVLPIENSYAGEVGQVIDLMFSGPLYINGVYDMKITQNLLGVPGAKLEDIKHVISHPQALSQCNKYIKEWGFTIEEERNTAVAAQRVAEMADPSIAAIASEDTAALYGLKVIDREINESSVNTTRFAVFSRAQKEKAKSAERLILMFTVKNEVGALAKAVNIICAHGFNMNVLRSRPVKDVPWEYYFYVEAIGNQYDEEGVELLRELNVCCSKLKIVGHYDGEVAI